MASCVHRCFASSFSRDLGKRSINSDIPRHSFRATDTPYPPSPRASRGPSTAAPRPSRPLPAPSALPRCSTPCPAASTTSPAALWTIVDGQKRGTAELWLVDGQKRGTIDAAYGMREKEMFKEAGAGAMEGV